MLGRGRSARAPEEQKGPLHLIGSGCTKNTHGAPQSVFGSWLPAWTYFRSCYTVGPKLHRRTPPLISGLPSQWWALFDLMETSRPSASWGSAGGPRSLQSLVIPLGRGTSGGRRDRSQKVCVYVCVCVRTFILQ